MNRQINYIIQGFLLSLLFPIGVFVTNKINSIKPVQEDTGIIIDFEIAPKSNVAHGASYKGKALFIQKCASCHHIYKDGTGPALGDLLKRGPWTDREKLYAWIRNPLAFMKKNEYAGALKEKYGYVMTAFPDISNDEINDR